ncbi:MAG TPA: aminoacyl-tRNA hydrolase [Actinomycetales bacterium]|nr:aminoacyl-tRNA hydrolase [Actinomycetales bacterium]
MGGTWLVMGLGNPGDRYARTRHNVGQMVVDLLAHRAKVRFQRHRSRALVATARLGTLPGGAPGPQVILAKSTGYMNLSGEPLGALVRAEGVELDRILVVHDELDLPPNELRLKIGGGEGGHNGLKSISQHLGTRDYARLRIGIGRPPGQMDPAEYVLREWRGKDAEEALVTVVEAADVVESVLLHGFDRAQMELHSP